MTTGGCRQEPERDAQERWLRSLKPRDSHGVGGHFAVREELWRLAKELADEQKRSRQQMQQWSQTLADLAEIAFSLQQAAASSSGKSKELLGAFAERLASVLEANECTWTDLAGRPLTDELQSVVNVVQAEVREDVDRPVIIQTLAPMVRWRGEVIRAADVVIGHPRDEGSGRARSTGGEKDG